MNKVSMYDKHGRIMGVTIYNQWGAAAVPKSFCRSHRLRLVILFCQDHKKVCDLPSLLYKKCVSNCLDSRLNGSISAYMQGSIVQSGADSTIYNDSYNSAQIAYL